MIVECGVSTSRVCGRVATCSTTNWAWRRRESSVKLVQPMDCGGTEV